MKKEQGFTLIELLIVVAIIAVIAAIAIPNLLDARMAANEASAVSALRSVSSAQINRMARQGANGTLAQLVNEGLLDSRFNAGGTINGYNITDVAGAIQGVPSTLTGVFISGVRGYQALPVLAGSTGRYDYAMGIDLVIRYGNRVPNTTPATTAGTPIGNR